MVDADLDAAAEAIVSGEVFRWYGFDHDSARRSLIQTRGDVIVARLDGEVVGVAIYWTDGLMPIPAYLHLLAVRAGYRSRGVGHALLRHVEEETFKRGPNLFLCCTKTNRGARRFYEREGYQAVGELPSFLREGLDEILYRKTRGPIREYSPI